MLKFEKRVKNMLVVKTINHFWGLFLLRGFRRKIFPRMMLAGLFFMTLPLSGAKASEELESALWPAEWRDNVAYMLDGQNNEFFLCLKSKEQKKFKIRIIMDIPSCFSIIAMGNFRGRLGQGALTPEKVTEKEISIDNVKYKRFLIDISEGELFPVWKHNSSVNIIIRPQNSAGGNFDIHWRLEWGGNSTGAEKTIKTTVLSIPENWSSPKEILLMPLQWLGMSTSLPGSSLISDGSWADSLIARKVNSFGYSGTPRRMLVEEIQKRKIPFLSYCMGLKQGRPDKARKNWAVDCNGEKKDSVISPTYMIKHWRTMDEYISRVAYYAKKAGNMVMTDHEPANGMKYSFDNDSIEMFCEREKIQDKKLSPKDILTNYKKEWVKFRCWQNSEMLKSFAQVIHEAEKSIEVIVCAQKMFPEETLQKDLERTGMDIRDTDRIKGISGHAPMIYEKDVKKYVREVKRTVLSVSKPVYPIMMYQRQPAPEAYQGYLAPLGAKKGRLQIISSIAEGAKGVMVWPWEGMDGKDWLHFALAANELAKTEEYFLRGKDNYDFCRAKGLPEKEYHIDIQGKKLHVKKPKWDEYITCKNFELDGKTLSLIFNFHPSSKCYCELSLPSLPDGKYILFDPTTENMLCKSREKPYFTNAELACGVLCRIPEEDVRFYLLKSYAPKAEVQKAAYESDIRKEYDIIKKDNEKETENISSDGISISWADIDKDNVPELVIENKIQKVWINFSGGRIMKWLRKDRNLVKWNKNNGGLCMDIFQSSAWNGDEKAEYELISKMINDGRAVVVLQKKLKNSVLSGIVITKEFTVSGDKAEILVKYNINNESDSSKKISLRIHNKFNLPGGQDFIVPCEDGVKAFSGNANGKTDLYCCGRDVSPKMKSRSQGIFAGDWIVCASPKIKDGVCARIDGDRVSSVYSFQGRQPTCEWFYKLFTLEKNTNWQTEFSFKYLSDLQGSIIDATLNANK